MGKEQERWNILTGGSQQKTIAKDAIKQLDAKFSRVLKAAQNNQPPLRTPLTSAVKLHKNPDEIPF